MDCKGKFYGRGFRGVRYIEAILRGKSPFGSVVLSAVRNREASASRRLTMLVISICDTDFVRCREVVRHSEGPLWEVRLYIISLDFPCPTFCTSTKTLANSVSSTFVRYGGGPGFVYTLFYVSRHLISKS